MILILKIHTTLLDNHLLVLTFFHRLTRSTDLWMMSEGHQMTASTMPNQALTKDLIHRRHESCLDRAPRLWGF